MKNKIAFFSIFLLVASMALSVNISPIQAQTELEIETTQFEFETIETQIGSDDTKSESDESKSESDDTKSESDESKSGSDDTKSESDESKIETKPLRPASNLNSVLKIATAASEQIGRQLSNMDEVPEDVKELYDQGLNEVELLREAISDKDRIATEKHFLSAMKIFRQITSLSSDKPMADAISVRAIPRPDLQSNHDRMEKYLTSLKAIAERHNAEIDFTKIDQLMDLTQNQIDENDSDEAKKNMDKLQRIILNVNKVLREKATQKTAEKAASFAQKYMNVLEKLISQAKELGHPEETINKLEEQKTKLSTTKNPSQIIKEIRGILTMKEQVDLSRVDMIKSRANQLDQKIESLTDIDSSTLDQLRDDLATLQELINQNNFDKAQKLLRDLTKQLKELQSSS